MKKHRNSAKPVALAARPVNPASAYGLKEAEEYWKNLGHTVRHDDDGLFIKLANDGRLRDYGDRMVLHRAVNEARWQRHLGDPGLPLLRVVMKIVEEHGQGLLLDLGLQQLQSRFQLRPALNHLG